MIRIGFWGFLLILIVESTPDPIPIIKAPLLLGGGGGGCSAALGPPVPPETEGPMALR